MIDYHQPCRYHVRFVSHATSLLLLLATKERVVLSCERFVGSTFLLLVAYSEVSSLLCLLAASPTGGILTNAHLSFEHLTSLWKLSLLSISWLPSSSWRLGVLVEVQLPPGHLISSPRFGFLPLDNSAFSWRLSLMPFVLPAAEHSTCPLVLQASIHYQLDTLTPLLPYLLA